MKYIGNKTRLLDFICESMQAENIPFNGTFCDIFGGTGSVGRFFKEHGFEIISNDFMTYSYIVQYVKVKLNEMPNFTNLGLGPAKEVLKYLNNLEPQKGFIFENFAPSGIFHRQYFSDINAQRIDSVREQIENWKNSSLISKDEYFVLLSSLIDAADFVANISGTYGAYLKIWRSMALKPLTLLEPQIFNNNKNNSIYQTDANELIKKINCDVLYIDPPYNERQYAPNFHVLESLAVWDKPMLNGKTGQRDYSTKKSLYCQKSNAISAFKALIENAKAKYIVVSYNNEGIIPKDNMIRILENKGEVKEYTTDYRRFRTERDNDHRQYKNCDDKVIEHLYIVKSYILGENK